MHGEAESSGSILRVEEPNMTRVQSTRLKAIDSKAKLGPWRAPENTRVKAGQELHRHYMLASSLPYPTRPVRAKAALVSAVPVREQQLSRERRLNTRRRPDSGQAKTTLPPNPRRTTLTLSVTIPTLWTPCPARESGVRMTLGS